MRTVREYEFASAPNTSLLPYFVALLVIQHAQQTPASSYLKGETSRNRFKRPAAAFLR